MKNPKTIKFSTVKNLGYIIGAVVGLIAAITVFVFTENIAISIPLFVGLSIPLGISFEQKLKHENKEMEPIKMKLMISLIVIGVVLFFVILFSTRFI